MSIFINPNQFNSKKDYKKYPKNIDKDLSILKKLKVDFVYLPSNHHIYSSKRKFKIALNNKDKILCAKHRKGHFEGVIDVMDRLTKLIKPKKIFMGEKDFQQLFLIKNYFKNRYNSKIIPCKTIRDNKKLALSSRNLQLNNKDLTKARNLIKNLFSFNIEYLELRNIENLKISNKFHNSRLFVAYYINGTRLIDNI